MPQTPDVPPTCTPTYHVSIPCMHPGCTGLKRVNLSNLKLEAVSQRLAKELRERCLSTREGIYWGPDGKKEVQT